MQNQLKQKQILCIFVFMTVIFSSMWPTVSFRWFDAFFYLIVDGSWILSDVLQYTIALIFCLVLSGVLLCWKKWPWDITLLWVPYLIWNISALGWSIYPSYSAHGIVRDIIIAQSVFIFGYAINYSRALALKTQYYIVLLAVFCSVVAMICFPVEKVAGAGLLFDGVLFSNWFSYLLGLMLPVLWLKMQRRPWGEISWLVLLLLTFTTLASMRIVWLASLACLVVCVVSGRFGAGFSDDKKAYLILFFWCFFLVAGYIYTGIFKPADGFVPDAGGDFSAWYMTFFKNERYRIWGFWISQSLNHWWGGVGLGWEVPRFAYAKYKPDYFPLVFVSHGHNLFLNQYLQLGLVGVLLYAGAWMLIFKKCLVFFKGHPAVRWCGMAIISMLVMLCAKNFTDDGMRDQNILLYFLLLGCLFGRARRPVGALAQSLL